MFWFQWCPRCRAKSFLSRLNVYRCRVCGQFCCDRCLRRGLFSHSCPHCGARASVVRAGYAR